MNFEKFFRFVSYAAVACGFFSLWFSGTFGIAGTAVFLSVMIAAWFLEDTRWQISEKVGTALIVLALPVFFLVWRFQIISLYGSETVLAGILARMILSLTAVKLLQKKSDRDWIFLYLMSFFEVLLAAGLSISAMYLMTFLSYLLVMVCAVIAFEIRKTSRAVDQKMAAVPAASSATASPKLTGVRRLPVTAITLIFFIVMIAVPLFFALPRVGGAGFGGNQSGLRMRTGFSDSVKLGSIGDIQTNDAVAMRVKVEPDNSIITGLYFRGVALDTFDGKTWSRSSNGVKEPLVKGERDAVTVDFASSRDELVEQTIYLEPMDTPVLFALTRPVLVQGELGKIAKDRYGALTFEQQYKRVSYKVVSDLSVPAISRLQEDKFGYGSEMQNYLQLPPQFDKRIFDLAYSIASNEKNRYDKAAAIEQHLQTKYAYTLDQEAGGEDPLADFLFNVRAGHCEYFATAMVIMLRSQGIASRIVNGFHGGDYNSTAGMTIVKERNAHSWVEVFFPKENAWVRFDPTPYAGETGGAGSGIAGKINNYLEALEAFWIQNFVAFDNQEQRSLVRGLRNGFVDYQGRLSSYFGHAQESFDEWWSEVRGDQGKMASLTAIGYGVAYVIAAAVGMFLLGWLCRKVVKLKVWRRMGKRLFGRPGVSIVEFYDRMLQVLGEQGFVRLPYQTPLEFAYAVEMPAALRITEKYNRVRFGAEELSRDEAAEIETLLRQLQTPDNRQTG